MKRILKYFFVIAVISCFAAGKSFAQVMPKSFTEGDPVKFINEMRDFFESYDRKDGKDFIEEFNEKYLLSGKVPEDVLQAMYMNANLMLKRKFRPAPEYYAYFNTIKAIADHDVPGSTFLDWQSCFVTVGNGKLPKPFSEFILMSENLFKDGRFFRTASGEWWTEGGSWKFACDSVAAIRFTNVTLKARQRNDSTKVDGTTGIYYLNTKTFVGREGKVNWLRTGISEDDMHAELKNYSINVPSFNFVADSVTFYDRTHFQSKPLLGKLTERLVPDVQEKTANYPRFESYSSRYQIKSMYPNVDYEGGFSQVGGKFMASGSTVNPAFFIFKRNGKNFLTVKSTNFSITQNKVTSQNASIKFFLDTDSIVHSAIEFKYFIDDDSSRVVLYRSDEGAAQAPYYNSFHKVDMYVQQIVWFTNHPQIIMNTLPGTTQGEAQFPSETYYRQHLYSRLQMTEPVHPLIKIRNFVRDANNGTRTFTTLDLARYWKIGAEQLRPTIMDLSNQGFLYFDPATDMITYKDKCDRYIAARAGKIDYDNLLFESKVAPGGANAKLNLLNYDLTLLGVKQVELSDSQNVVVFPAEDMIILKKDRNFSFEGSIMAGRFDYYGKLFSFDYSTFSFNLTNVDSVRIWVDSPQRDPSDPKGGFVQMKVRSVIENLNGKLEVDFPGNRSGIWSKKYPQYPVFTSAKPAFVYYDKKTIQRGVYVRDQFYFKMDPFTIDSLDNFQSNSMRFTGILASAGIFPDMRDTLRLMSDYSLGFTRKTPPEGYQIYGGKAKFTNMIRLSNAGLHGNGPLDYITSTALSNDFIFYPDSTNGVASSYVIREQNIPGRTEYPQVNVSNAYIHYMPKRDFMNSTNRDSLFTVYTGSKATFGGTMSLSPKNLAGNGKLSFSSAELISNKMVLAVNTSDADTASFRLKALELARISFSTDNVKAHIDLDLREGEFKANGEGTIVTFDVNQYICFMDNFKWYMDKEEIELNGAENTRSGDKIDLTGPEFISIHPKQDSLRFNAPRALYNHREHIIYARGVQEILVADARIVPDSGYVVLERNAYMRTLTNSQITANTVTNYHHVFNCVTDIYSRHNYVSTGDYAFIDELKKEQIIHFAKITPDSSGQTYAEGLITDSMQFNLSPAFDYRGRVVLAANNQFLVFEGTTGLMHNCAFGNSRLFFKGEINPAEIYIPVVNSPVNDKQEPITTGIVSTVSVDSTHIYGSFLSPKKGKTDVNIVNADGFLFYEKSSREYRISNRQKLVERSLPGNYVSVSTKNCIVYGEGKMTMHGNLGKVFINPIGNSTHNTVNHTTKFDLIMGIDFYFNDKLMDILIEDINASASLTGTDPGRPTYQRALAEMVGKERADKLIAEITIKGEYKKFPDELRYTFFFTDVQMAWNQATRAYISSGLLGLQSIGKEMINKYIPGTIMLERKKGQDILTIYFDLENGKWYTFVYINGSMAVYSTNTKFMEDFKAIKDDDKSAPDDYNKSRLGDVKGRYKFTPGSPAEQNQLRRKLKRASDLESAPVDPGEAGLGPGN